MAASNITIGIDPGKTGAIAFIGEVEGEPICRVFDLPIIESGALSWVDGGLLRSLILDNRSGLTTAIVERVGAMPAQGRKQGAASSFNFGAGFGSILGCLQSVGVRIELVTPSKWKRDLGLDGEKETSRHRARLLFPDAELHLKKHNGRAEALLIAHWYLTREQRAAA
jgi:crossover junction endodeoxyribonuclease RuvC